LVRAVYVEIQEVERLDLAGISFDVVQGRGGRLVRPRVFSFEAYGAPETGKECTVPQLGDLDASDEYIFVEVFPSSWINSGSSIGCVCSPSMSLVDYDDLDE